LLTELGPKLMAQCRGTGIDLGYKRIGNRPTEAIAFRFFVEKKKPTSAVRDDERVPGELEGFPTDVIEETFIPYAAPAPGWSPMPATKGHFRTLIGGISIGVGRVLGTLGCRVTDARSGNPDAFVSNAHVLSPRNRQHLRVVQPSRTDGGRTPQDYCAKEERTVRVVPRGHGVNRVDASIALVQPGRLISQNIFQLGSVRGTSYATLGDRVQKCGRTTGVTSGVIDGIAHRDSIPYPGLSAEFVDQILIRPDPFTSLLSQPGDSGSMWLDKGMRVIGLLFAGGTWDSLANPVSEVQSSLGVIIPTGTP